MPFGFVAEHLVGLNKTQTLTIFNYLFEVHFPANLNFK
jgi:hypothetical protein